MKGIYETNWSKVKPHLLNKTGRVHECWDCQAEIVKPDFKQDWQAHNSIKCLKLHKDWRQERIKKVIIRLPLEQAVGKRLALPSVTWGEQVDHQSLQSIINLINPLTLVIITFI